MILINKKSFFCKTFVLFSAFSILLGFQGVGSVLAIEIEDEFMATFPEDTFPEAAFYCEALQKDMPKTSEGEAECQKAEEERRRADDFKREEERRYEDERRREEERRREDELRSKREEEERRQLEEKERERFKKERFHQMKRDLKRFTREIDRMQREIDRAKKRFERCDLPIPSWAKENVDKARTIISKIESAKTAEELEDLMFEIDEVGFKMRDWGHEMGSLYQVCDMLAGAKRELRRIEREQERMEKRAERRNSVGLKIMLAKSRELMRKMKAAVDKAVELAKTDPEEAVFILEDEFFFKMEDYNNAMRGIEMALDVSRGLRDAGREIKEFEQRIAELKRDGEETSRLEHLLNKMRSIKKKIESIVARGAFEPRDIDNLIEETFNIREEIITLLKHQEKGRFYIKGEDNIGREFEEDGFDIPDAFVPSARRRAIIEVSERGGVADSQIQKIKEKAEFLMGGKLDTILTELKELRNVVKEQEAEIKFLKKLSGELKKINAEMKEKLNAFVAYGVDENSQKLGAGERAAVLHSYESAYGALPEDEKDIEDMVKIVNGRFPSQRSSVAEKQARRNFKKIFKRVANLNNANDNAAIMIMAYGLRQTAKNRNLESEKQGIKTFRAIFKNVPQTTDEWNAMQAITYSGAVRKADMDKDSLSDEDEKVFGTDPNNADTDGDGIPDGTEIDEGFDPLLK